MSQLSKAEIARFYEHAQAVYPREACGLVVKKGRKAVFIPVDNIAQDATEEFEMHPDQQRAIEESEEVIGLIHSHPDCLAARASDSDVACCNMSDMPWTIVTVPGCDVVEIQPESAPLIGRPFVLGSYDCWGLIVDWHKHQGLDIPAYPERPSHAWWEGEDGADDNPWYSEKNILAAGFEFQDKPTIGSVIFMQVAAKVVNHVGVILPDGQMLHHLYGQLSGRTPYGNYWRDRTWYIVRHRDLPAEKDIKPC